MLDVVPFALVVVVCALGALTAAGSRARRALGIALSLSSLGAPWLLPKEDVLVRATLALFAFCGRCVDGSPNGHVEHRREALARRIGRRYEKARARHVDPGGPSSRACPGLGGSGRRRLLLRHARRTAHDGRTVLGRPLGRSARVRLHTLRGGYGLLFATYRLMGFRPPLLHRHPLPRERCRSSGAGGGT